MGLAHQLHLKGQPLVVPIFIEKKPACFSHIFRYGSISIISQAGKGSASSSFSTFLRFVFTTAPACLHASPSIENKFTAPVDNWLVSSSSVISASPNKT